MRFPEFSGEWEKNNLSKFSSKITKKNKSNFINDVLCNSANLGIIPQNDYFDRDIANADNTDSYYIIEQGDFVYNPRKSTAAPYGPVNIYNGEKPGIISPLYLCFSVFNISPSFLFYRFKSSVWHPYVYSHGDTGVRYDRVSIKDDVFFDMPIYTPTQNEQEKIATLLSLIDERIATQNKIIEDLKKLKCAIIDYTFDNKTQSHRKRILLSDVSAKITRRNTDNQNFNVLSNSANQGIIPQNEVFDREIANENNTSNYFVISQNDFVYNPRKSVTAPYGPINRYNGETNGVISPLYLCFRCYGIDVEYLGWYFKSDSWHKYVYQNGDTGVRHDRVSIKDEIFFSMPLYLHSTEEQMEIAKRLNKIESFVSQEEKYLGTIKYFV